jgi:hypothetical protein
MHSSSYNKMMAFANSLLHWPQIKFLGKSIMTIVDYGSQDMCGSYKELFVQPNWKYIGIDIAEGKNVDIVLSDPYDWKEIATSSVDVFISGQAFEHTEYIWLTMLEIERILKPLGLVCIIAPSAGPEHRFPVDCWRIYPDGFKALAKFANLDVISAITEWDPPDGCEWKDSMLIAYKANNESISNHDLDELRNNLKRYIVNIMEK